jgi:hypothetical protein
MEESLAELLGLKACSKHPRKSTIKTYLFLLQFSFNNIVRTLSFLDGIKELSYG